MANGKTMANPGLGRGYTKAELEAKVHEIHAESVDLNKRTEDALASSRWHPYFAGAGLAFGLVALLSAIFPDLTVCRDALLAFAAPPAALLP